MMFARFFRPTPELPRTESLQLGAQAVPLLFVHQPRARRYLLRLRPDGTARVTVPRGGSLAAAREFARKHGPWLERQLHRLAQQRQTAPAWQPGTTILFRGEWVRIEAGAAGEIRFGPEQLAVPDAAADLKRAIQNHLYALARRELPVRVGELAREHGIEVVRVSVRNQRSRWGSCSRRGTISLNWRLVQAPDFVRDYIILHELAHRRHMNHSARFWEEVARWCPDYGVAEQWLKAQRANLQ